MERLEQKTFEDLDAWEAGCLTDDARNAFVLPYLRKLLRERVIAHVLDLGCGTGYVSRALVQDPGAPEMSWTLLDQDKRALEYARSRWPPSQPAQFLECDVAALGGYDGQKADLVIICYSMLEFVSLKQSMQGISHLCGNNATAVIFMPDCLEDVLAALRTDPTALSRYLAGDCSLNKFNSFLSRSLPFFAHRVENIIETMLETGWSLRHLGSFVSSSGKRHYCLEFGRAHQA